MSQLINENPVIHKITVPRKGSVTSYFSENLEEELGSADIYELIRDILDPEHPYTLEELNVLGLDNISMKRIDGLERRHVYCVFVEFVPTVPHCSMSTLIGLCIRVRLMKTLPINYKIIVKIKQGAHYSEKSINKQLADKERVSAAMENSDLLELVNQCLSRYKLVYS